MIPTNSNPHRPIKLHSWRRSERSGQVFEPSDVRRSFDHETKFVLPDHRAAFFESWLSSRCRPDPVYPVSIISSLYFDTADWRFLREKDESDFLKTKVRLRWYNDYKSRAPIGGLFLEVKRKVGSRRNKARVEVDQRVRELLDDQLSSAGFLAIDHWLAIMGENVSRPLVPVIEISYRRRRFVEALSGARVCIDSQIGVSRVNPRMMGHMPVKARLKTSVLELKGDLRALPKALRSVIGLGCRKDVFSKYWSCCRSLNRT